MLDYDVPARARHLIINPHSKPTLTTLGLQSFGRCVAALNTQLRILPWLSRSTTEVRPNPTLPGAVSLYDAPVEGNVNLERNPLSVRSCFDGPAPAANHLGRPKRGRASGGGAPVKNIYSRR